LRTLLAVLQKCSFIWNKKDSSRNRELTPKYCCWKKGCWPHFIG